MPFKEQDQRLFIEAAHEVLFSLGFVELMYYKWVDRSMQLLA